MRRTVAITDSVLEALIHSRKMQEKFAFIRQAAADWNRVRRTLGAGCRSCEKKRHGSRKGLLDRVRWCMMSLTSEQAAFVKSVLRVDEYTLPVNDQRSSAQKF